MNDRKQWWIASALIVAISGSLAFMVSYVARASTQVEGFVLAIALAGLVGAALGWSAWIIGPDRVIDRLDEYPSSVAEREAARTEIGSVEKDVARSGVLLKLLYLAVGAFGVAVLLPFRSWGPAPGRTLFSTKWKRGARLVREDGQIVTQDALNVDSIITVFPEGAIGDAASQTVLIRLPPGIESSINGYVAYSNICTHAGCPVALYRSAMHQLICPCHQSIFDVVNGGKVLSGPADHALPQLPLEIDAQGDLRATGDYPVPIGPGFWERA